MDVGVSEGDAVVLADACRVSDDVGVREDVGVSLWDGDVDRVNGADAVDVVLGKDVEVSEGDAPLESDAVALALGDWLGEISEGGRERAPPQGSAKGWRSGMSWMAASRHVRMPSVADCRHTLPARTDMEATSGTSAALGWTAAIGSASDSPSCPLHTAMLEVSA